MRGIGRATKRSQLGNREARVRGRGLGVGGREIGFRVGQVGNLPRGAKALQLGEGAIVGALGGINATLQAGEAFGVAAIGIADGGVLI